MKIVTCIAPVNIAVIKYWGKRDEELILPINDSISSTLSTKHLCTTTTIVASPDLKGDTFWLNGKEETLDNPRLKNCLKEIKSRADPALKDILNWKLSICSKNNFPTAAGLASSAAGYACLVYTLATLYNVKGDLSELARRGSGSACRSTYGGWVHWVKGKLENGSDSIAKEIVPASHWPEMRILILVVNDVKKKYSSTLGMRKGVETSELLKFRATHVVPNRIDAMIRAIKTKDFRTFAILTMQDSNQFHATCLDTFPPCFYLNDVSRSIIETVHAYNDYKGTIKVAYTFDAGPNACLYLLNDELDEFASVINYVFPPSTNSKYFRGNPTKTVNISEDLCKHLGQKQQAGLLKYVISTEVGEGPQVIQDPAVHLLKENGEPK